MPLTMTIHFRHHTEIVTAHEGSGFTSESRLDDELDYLFHEIDTDAEDFEYVEIDGIDVTWVEYGTARLFAWNGHYLGHETSIMIPDNEE